jgi:hypothetical protein
MQRWKVHHAGDIIELPMLPVESIMSLRQQLKWLALKPVVLPNPKEYEQLRDEQTMEQAGIASGCRAIFMACYSSAEGVAAAAPHALSDWFLCTRIAPMQAYVSRIHAIHESTRDVSFWRIVLLLLHASAQLIASVGSHPCSVCSTDQDADGQDDHLGGRFGPHD